MRLRYAFLLLLLLAAPAAAQTTVADYNPLGPYGDNFRHYISGMTVKYNGSVFICNVSDCGLNVAPGSAGDTGFWKGLSGAFQWKDSPHAYGLNEYVMRNGSIWTSVVPNTGKNPSNQPANAPYWTQGPSNSPISTPGGLTGAAIQAAIDAAPAGGIVQLACATYNLDGTPITINKPLTVQGCGKRNATILVSPASGEDVIQVDVGVAGGAVTIRSFTMQAPTTANCDNALTLPCGKTGGSFIHLLTTAGGFTIIDDMTFAGHLVALDMEAATQWTVSNSYLVGRNNNGTNDIWIRSTTVDNGAQMIWNNVFDNGRVNGRGSCILYQSGGGGSIIGNQFLGHAVGVNLSWVPPVGCGLPINCSSSEIKMVGNTFDGQNTPGDNQSYGILFVNNSNGSVSGIQVTGNSFINHRVAGIAGSGSTSAQISGVTIAGNTFIMPNGSIGVNSTWGSSNITANQFTANGTTATGIAVTVAAADNFVAANNFTGTWTAKVTNGSGSSVVGVTSGNCRNGIVIGSGGC